MYDQSLIIFGFGGHARSVADVALACGYSALCFVEPNAQDGELFLEHPVHKELPYHAGTCFFAAGDSELRKNQMKLIIEQDWKIETLIAPSATRCTGASIQVGAFVGHHAHIGPMAKIGVGCIINTAAVIEHECEVGDFSHVSVNTTLAGRVTIGRNVFVGASAVVKDKITIGDNITIGAGAVVVDNLLEPGIYVGIPAKRLQQAYQR